MAHFPATRTSLANSAGICIGAGLRVWAGAPRPRAIRRRASHRGPGQYLRPVALVEAEVLQVRHCSQPNETVGYGATWTARRATAGIAVLNIGYADGYARAFSNRRSRCAPGTTWLPVVGRVSMDLLAVDATGQDVAEGDWLALDPDLARAAHVTGCSQYELLTALGHRYVRHWS